MQKATEYIELARAQVSKRRTAVISQCSKGGYTVAQQLEAEEDGKTTCVFLKGAIHVDDLDGLYNLRDALNEAIVAMGVQEEQEESDGESDEELYDENVW